MIINLIIQIAQQQQITWYWVRGHTGHIGNERVDKLANFAISNALTR